MRIHAVPQWQGSGRADRLREGCRTLSSLAGKVLGAPVAEVAVETGGSSTVDGIANREVLQYNRLAQLGMLRAARGPVLTIGGDCGADLAPVDLARQRYGNGLGVVWFDAHADCNTPATSPSGAFHGMVLRALLGEGDPGFTASPALARGRALLAGTREFDPDEREPVAGGLVRHVPVPVPPSQLAAELRDSGATKVYLHLDLDVLDPEAFAATNYPTPDGITIEQLVAGIEALSEFDVVGAAITECTAEARDQVEPLVPVVDAIGAVLD